MTREEHWRQRLIELKTALKTSQASIAAAIKVEPSYVSRLLYPPGKAGRKNIGLETMRSLLEAYSLPPDWFDRPLGSDLPSESGQSPPLPHIANEPSAEYGRNVRPLKSSWPFALVTPTRLAQLKSDLGPRSGADAMRDIDALLDVAVTKWERIAQHKKTAK